MPSPARAMGCEKSERDGRWGDGNETRRAASSGRSVRRAENGPTQPSRSLKRSRSRLWRCRGECTHPTHRPRGSPPHSTALAAVSQSDSSRMRLTPLLAGAAAFAALASPCALHLPISSTRLADLALVFATVGRRALAWTAEDHEIFDLVSALEAAEGKGTNFCACRSPHPQVACGGADSARWIRPRRLVSQRHQVGRREGAQQGNPEALARIAVRALSPTIVPFAQATALVLWLT